jgi:hypothetical protein
MHPPPDNELQRISWRTIGGYIFEVLNLERGIGYTFLELLLRPGQAIREYLFVDRSRLVKPLPLLLLMATLTTFFSFHFLDLDTELIAREPPEHFPPAIWDAITRVLPWLRQYFHLALIFNIPAYALATFLVFRGHRLFFPEHLVINIYLNCLQSMFSLISIPLIPKFPAVGTGLALLSLIYFFYAITSIFEQNWWPGLWKTLAVFILGQLFYSLILTSVILILANF